MSSAEGALAWLGSSAGSSFENLDAAREATRLALEEKRSELADIGSDDDASVVQFGSWGRGELTAKSDDDWAVLVAGPCRHQVNPQLDSVHGILGEGVRRPGAQGVFGGNIFCDDLVGNIGLQEDDNKNLTRRALLLLESVALTNPDARQSCRERILEGYLDWSVKAFRPPRFLLNDLVRYWRTICVDFVGKERQNGRGEKWGIRNAKLRTSRKTLFVSGLLPVLMCYRHDRTEIPCFLEDQFSALATDRVADAFLAFDALDAGLRTFDAYDRWLGFLADESTRRELEALPRDKARDSELFHEITRLSEELEGGLLTLLFDTELYIQVRDFGIF